MEEEFKKIDVKVMALKLETSDVVGSVQTGGDYIGWLEHKFLGMYYPEENVSRVYLINKDSHGLIKDIRELVKIPRKIYHMAIIHGKLHLD